MAIALVNANRGQTTTSSAGFDEPIDLPAGASIAVGNHLILMAAYDNSGTSGVDPEMFVAASAAVGATPYVDLRGNTWTRLAKAVRDPANANEGAVVDAWITRVQFPYSNGDDITVQWFFSVSAAVLRIAEYSGIRPITYSIVTPISGTGSATTIGPTGTITPTATGQMVLGVAAVEDNSALTGDADSTNGSWSAVVSIGVGSGATGMSLGYQHKVVTGTSAQDWDITKTGASDYAAVAIVLDEFVDAGDPTVLPGNPNNPCIAGFEGLPTENTAVSVDTGTAYFFRHEIPPNSLGIQDYTVGSAFQQPSETSQHHVAFDLYKTDAELVQDEIVSLTLPLRNATLSGATTTSGTALAALSVIGGAQVIMDDGESVILYFNPTQLIADYANARVLRWGIRYLAWKDDSSPLDVPLGEGFEASWSDTAAGGGFATPFVMGGWLVPNYARDVTYQTRWLGEVNPIPRGKGIIVTSNSPEEACFTVNDLSHMANGDQATSLIITGQEGPDLLQSTVYMDYIEMVIELAPERREAQVVRSVSNAPYAGSIYPFTFTGVRMYSALNSNTRYTVPLTDNDYVLSAREALPASSSDLYQARTSGANQVSLMEAIGPSAQMLGYLTPRATLEPQPEVRRATVSGGVFAGTVTEFDQYTLSAVAYDIGGVAIDGSFWTAYQSLAGVTALQVYTGNPHTQYVLVDGATTYDQLKILVKPDALTSADLDISIEQPLATPIATATVSINDYSGLPNVGDDYAEVTVSLSTPITPAAGRVAIVMSSTTGATAPWTVASALPDAGLGRYGYDLGAPNNSTSPQDYAVVLTCELDDPDGDVTTTQVDLYRAGERCLQESMDIPRVTINNGSDFDHISIERSINGMNYVPVILLSDPIDSEVFDDYEVPWDLPAGSITYRLIGYRNSDRRSTIAIIGPWAGTSTAPGAAFGLAIPGGLYAYVPTSGGTLEVEWNPLNPIDMVQLHGVDYQIALRAPEERGLSVSVNVVVDKIAVACTDESPGEEDGEMLAPGPKSFSPTPFNDIRLLESYDRMTLKLPGGHTRNVAVNTGALTTIPVHGVYMAEIALTDVVPAQVDPYS